MIFENFYGNPEAARTLLDMHASGRIPQTLLLSGPAGVGKATLVRRFAALVLFASDAAAARIEQDDLSLPHNQELIAEREKLTSDKRADEPLVFSSHPDFVTFAPEGPLRQLSIGQIRLLKDQAQLMPSSGERRIFLLDQVDRANDQAANSLLKVLEEPPPHLIICMTAENPYDLLPTIRSRSVSIPLSRLDETTLAEFLHQRKVPDAERRARLANGSPGLAVAWDLEAYDRRRAAMLVLLEVASRRAPFAAWAKYADSVGRTDKLENYLEVIYSLLEDILLIGHGFERVRNADLRAPLEAIANTVSFPWLRAAMEKTTQISQFARRNINKAIALDALALELRDLVPAAR
jgi:DNA polymerase-3 subunit delta'